MSNPSRQQIIQHRNKLRLDAKKLFGFFTPPESPQVGLMSPAQKKFSDYGAVLPPQVKTTSRKRKISQDMTIFQSRHKTREIISSLNFNDLFDIQEKLGEGAQSTVKKCIEKSSGKTYAVKLFKSDTQLIANLKMQYKILKTLSSQFIIQAYYLFVNPKQNSSQMILEYCPFPSLRQYLQDQMILSQDECSAIVNKLLIALAYMHGKGICHRDIKPENILYEKQSGNIKLIDFEIAKVCKNKFVRIEMWTKTGTVQYCAPQIFSDSYTELVDVWAIGILTYELLCGKFPFNIQYVKDAQEILKFEPQFPQSMSNFARDFIKRCLTKNPLQRPTAKECLSSPFLLVGSNHSPTPPSDKLNHSFDDCSTWSNAQSFKQSMKCVQEQMQEFVGDDIGIRCFMSNFQE